MLSQSHPRKKPGENRKRDGERKGQNSMWEQVTMGKEQQKKSEIQGKETKSQKRRAKY